MAENGGKEEEGKGYHPNNQTKNGSICNFSSFPFPPFLSSQLPNKPLSVKVSNEIGHLMSLRWLEKYNLTPRFSRHLERAFIISDAFSFST